MSTRDRLFSPLTNANRTYATRTWIILAVLTVLAVYFYVFMEWIFFATKPSFMTKLLFLARLHVLLATPALPAAAGIIVTLVLWIPAMIIRHRPFQKAWTAAVLLVPSIILSAALLLMIDNFTYTIFKFGIKTSEGFQRFAYVFLVLVLVALSYRFLLGLARKLQERPLFRGLCVTTAGIFAISIIAVIFVQRPSSLSSFGYLKNMVSLKSRPNIILLASDGLNAEHMSAFGYHRNTTPFIRSYVKEALLCKNCFTNAGSSGGSIVSTFTGKLPTQTRLIYPPDILRGEDAYQHLPGILKMHGYRTIDISIRHYADPYDLNMQNSFDWANFREEKKSLLSLHLASLVGHDPSYFLLAMNDRITGRVLHVSGVRVMEDAFAEVTETDKRHNTDTGRINSLFDFVDASPAPFFAHLHLLGTHGPKFYFTDKHFSAGKQQREPWMDDFYDDAIRIFDTHVEEIFAELGKRGMRHKTLVIICTDHGQRFNVNARLPLMFIFPYGEHARFIKANVQNLDIAATILDYLGIEQPEWMGGQSLLSSEIDPLRFIFTVDRIHGGDKEVRTREGWELVKEKTGPPFYSLGAVGIFCCHKFFELELESGVLSVYNVRGHTSPCRDEEIPDPEVIGQAIIDHLAGNGYDTSSIKVPLSIRRAD